MDQTLVAELAEQNGWSCEYAVYRLEMAAWQRVCQGLEAVTPSSEGEAALLAEAKLYHLSQKPHFPPSTPQ